jgi:Zn finger protein HypA/HybF involved in hydrogenase expression
LSQAAKAKTAHPYTCPACRDSVRATRHNAGVATLLELYLQDNSSQDRTAEEKEEQDKMYKPGENIMPKLRRKSRSDRVRDRSRHADRDEDERIMSEVMAMSLEDVGLGASSGERPATRRDAGEREARAERRARRARSETRANTSRNANASSMSTSNLTASNESRSVGMFLLAGQESARSHRRRPSRHRDDVQVQPGPARSVEHQSSIRSLLSVSESAIEAEIFRQISEDSSLRGVDLDNLTQRQEDELAERIARAMRRERRRERETSRAQEASESNPVGEPQTSRRARSQGRELASAQPAENAPQNGTSRPNPAQHASHQTREATVPNSAGSAQPTAPSNDSSRSVQRHMDRQSSAPGGIETQRHESSANEASPGQTSRSRRPPNPTLRSSDSSNHAERPEGTRSQSRRVTDPTSNVVPAQDAVVETESQSPRNMQNSSVLVRPLPRSASDTIPTATESQSRATPQSSSVAQAPTFPSNLSRATTAQSNQSVTLSAQQTQALFPEPMVSCQRCHREDIQYEWFYTCHKCPILFSSLASSHVPGFHVCLSCYRRGEACLHWFGLGWVGWQRFERLLSSGQLNTPALKNKSVDSHGALNEPEEPHVLQKSRLLRPNAELKIALDEDKQIVVSSDDPAKRWQHGVFCNSCYECANDCYWRCDTCNEGEWGYCTSCVNTGMHCTHPLYSTRFVTKSEQRRESEKSSQGTAHDGSLSPNISTHSDDAGDFETKETWAYCAKCTKSIQPSTARLHCPQCNGGDYDLHRHCYDELIMTGKILGENGHFGWRRCLNNHRMIVVGFEDRGGQRMRVVDRDLVGGVAFKDEQLGRTLGSAADEEHGLAGQDEKNHDESNSSQIDGVWHWKDESGNKVRKVPLHRKTLSSPISPETSHSSSQNHHKRDQPPAHQSAKKQPFIFPPDGGVGERVVAKWPWWPATDSKDELAFPVRAEIREAENVNNDWWWGVYAGKKGFFPGPHVTLMK